MEYAIINTGGKQYKATLGVVLEIEKVDLEPGKDIVFDNVLLYTTNGTIKIGQPMLDGFSVKAKVLEQFKGEKIRVAKFKAKARYRRVQGHRQKLTRVEITKISAKK